MGPGSLTDFEPFNGWWMLSWGRNCMYTTEAVYHILMVAAWLALLERRWKICMTWVMLLAATHPFSGFQVLAIFVSFALMTRLGPWPERSPVMVSHRGDRRDTRLPRILSRIPAAIPPASGDPIAVGAGLVRTAT